MDSPRHLEKLCRATRGLLGKPPFGLLTDIDGTVSAIADTPSKATVSPACREALGVLGKRVAVVAVISGRSVEDAYEMVRLDDIVYFGNHGLERIVKGVRTPASDLAMFPPMLASVLARIRNQVRIPGLIFENKGLSGSIHYRLSEDREFAKGAILDAVGELAEPGVFRITEGKLVVEIKPDVEIDKGSALRWLTETYSLRSVVYLGDDRTDVDAMLVLKEMKAGGLVQGIGIAVAGSETPASVLKVADFVLHSINEVESFLGWTADQFSKR